MQTFSIRGSNFREGWVEVIRFCAIPTLVRLQVGFGLRLAECGFSKETYAI